MFALQQEIGKNVGRLFLAKRTAGLLLQTAGLTDSAVGDSALATTDSALVTPDTAPADSPVKVAKTFRCEVDAGKTIRDRACWGSANVVIYDKEDWLALFLSRAFFFRDSNHAEAVSSLLGLGAILKLNALPFTLCNDNSTVVKELSEKQTKKGVYNDVIRRITLLGNYLDAENTELCVKIPRSKNNAADSLGKIFAAPEKRGYIKKVWTNYLNNFNQAGDQKRLLGTTPIPVTKGQIGSLSGLNWIPDDYDPRNPFGLPLYYGRPTPVRSSEDLPMLRGVDFRHWHIILEPTFGSKDDSRDHLLHMYVKLLATALQSEEIEAKKKIYSATFDRYYGFGCLVDQETAESIECLPGVLVAVPDFFIVPELVDYGGEKVMNGVLVERSREDQTFVNQAMETPVGLPMQLRRKSDEQLEEERIQSEQDKLKKMREKEERARELE